MGELLLQFHSLLPFLHLIHLGKSVEIEVFVVEIEVFVVEIEVFVV